jgi:hypothetical protein
MAVGTLTRAKTKLLQLRGDRIRIIETSTVLAMDELRKFLPGNQ